jgi:hypothetical protein
MWFCLTHTIDSTSYSELPFDATLADYVRHLTSRQLACIIREAVEEWFWGGEITAKMLAAA